MCNWKWIEVHDQSGNAVDRQKPTKQTRFKISLLQWDLYDYSDAYIAVEETNAVTDPDNKAYDKKLAFKKNAPFISCITKISKTLVGNA